MHLSQDTWFPRRTDFRPIWRWDAIGKTLGTPVHKLLGGYTDRMRVTHMLGFRPAEELLDEALRFGEIFGITTFKLKVGRRPLSLDIEACRGLREGLGVDVEIYLDANRGWTANEAQLPGHGR